MYRVSMPTRPIERTSSTEINEWRARCLIGQGKDKRAEQDRFIHLRYPPLLEHIPNQRDMRAIGTAIASIVVGHVHIPTLDHLPNILESRVCQVLCCWIGHRWEYRR